jgi:hypothetical protein
MKQKILFALSLACLPLFTIAQKGGDREKNLKTYQKLDNYYVTDKFDKCVDAAMSYSEDDKYSKDPEPFLYTSMGFLGVYRNPDKYTLKKYPDYKDPLRKSLSYFGKFRKRDKTGEAFQSNQLYAGELKTETINFMNDLLNQEKQDKTRMGGYSREIGKAFPDDGVMLLLSGTHLVLSGNAGDGVKLIDSSYKYLKAVEEPKFDEAESSCLSKYFVLYTDYLLGLKKKESADKAKTLLELAAALLPEDPAIKEQQAKISE